MRKLFVLTVAALALSGLAVAELQNVEVGGSIRIRGNYYSSEVNKWESNPTLGRAWTNFWDHPLSHWENDLLAVADNFFDAGNSMKFIEQRTRLNVKADFTDEVCAFIELDSYDIWGWDFRSDYITGVDNRAVTTRDVEVYQAYIEASEMWGMPLSMRIGRQEIALGSQWLVGVNDTASGFTGLSFDAVVATYATDMFSVTALASKLAENGPVEEDGDVNLYGVYGSYLGLEDITIDAYWMLVRDARSVGRDTPTGHWLLYWPLDLLDNIVDRDDWEPTTVHTIGLRGAGVVGAFDFEAEIAYQFGDADQIGMNAMAPGFLLHPGLNIWHNDSVDFDNLGANLEVGYTFDIEMAPRIYLGGAFFEGDDDRRADNFVDWLYRTFCPVNYPGESLAFNRLFSNWEYSEFLDNTDLSNVWLIRGGVSAMPTEDLELLLAITYMETDEATDIPRIIFPWWTREVDNTLGWEVGLYATYNYSEDLVFEAGYAHLFVDDGLTDGNYVINNGLGNYPGSDQDDADYVYLETKICF